MSQILERSEVADLGKLLCRLFYSSDAVGLSSRSFQGNAPDAALEVCQAPSSRFSPERVRASWPWILLHAWTQSHPPPSSPFLTLS